MQVTNLFPIRSLLRFADALRVRQTIFLTITKTVCVGGYTIRWQERKMSPTSLNMIYLMLVQLLRVKIVPFLIKASNLAGLLTSIRQIFPDMEPCQIFFQNHEMRMSEIWRTRPLHGNEASNRGWDTESIYIGLIETIFLSYLHAVIETPCLFRVWNFQICRNRSGMLQ